jgi:hypothetical protein
MGKVVVNSRNNILTTLGIVDYLDARVSQYVLETSDVMFNNIDVTEDVIVRRDLTVEGDLTVSGSTTIISTEIVEIKDNIVLINSTETGSGVTSNLSGTEVSRGVLVNFQAVFEESSDLYKIGLIGDLQAVATREDSPLDKGVIVFNESLSRLDSVTTIELPLLFSGGVESSSSSTGTLKVQGGIGATGNIFIDKSISFLGTDYSCNIKSNVVSNDLLLTSGNDIQLIQPSSSKIILSDSVILQLGSSTDHTISCVLGSGDLEFKTLDGDITLITKLQGKLSLPEETYVRWGIDFNDIVFNGDDIILRSTGKFTVEANMTLGSTDPSLSPSIGSLVLNGGLSIDSVFDSVSSDNGGTFTTGGGAAFKKQVKIGGSLDIGDTDTTVHKGTNIGINFRSLSKNLTSEDSFDTTFNSFEGGSIVSSSSNITTASTVFIKSSPTISGGGSITDSYSLLVDSGKTLFKGDTLITSSTSSTSTNIGALVLQNGGLSINNGDDSVSSSNGGDLTILGGAALGKTLRIGQTIDIGDIPTSTPQVQYIGINIHSRNKVLNTESSQDATFNSFVGGSIVSTTSIINKASTLLIKGSPTISGGGTITNSYALLVDSGKSRMDGVLELTDNLEVYGNTTLYNTSDVTQLNGSGSSLRVLGGASIAKKTYFGGVAQSVRAPNASTVSHYTLGVTGELPRISIGLTGLESGANSGSNLVFSHFNDLGSNLGSFLTIERSSGVITFPKTTPSTSTIIGSLLLSGGISINNTTDAVDVDNGGTFTTGGGASIKKKLFVGGNTTLNSDLTVSGVSNLNKTIVNTNNGSFDISGNNGFIANVSATSILTASSGSMTIESSTGALILNSGTTTNITSDGNFLLNCDANTAINSNSGTVAISAQTNTITSTTGNTSITSTLGNITLTCDQNISLTTTNGGVSIARTVPGIPVDIGHTNSETTIHGDLYVGGDLTVLGTTTTIDSTLITINDNAVVVNAAPSGISDGGLLIRRFQEPNDSGLGQTVSSVPKLNGVFQAGSVIPGDLVLEASSSSVDDFYKGWWIKITSGSNTGVVRRIKEYNGATKVAKIYITADATPYTEGLDLTSAPQVGDNYSLYDLPYAGIYFSEDAQEIVVAGISFDIGSGQFTTPTSYLPMHVKRLLTEEGLTMNGDLSVIEGNTILKNNSETAFRVLNEDDRLILGVDTINNTVTVGSSVSTINSKASILFQQLDSVDGEVVYSKIDSVINNNISGDIKSSLNFTVNENYLLASFNGATQISTFNSKITILDSSPSTSTINGALILSGGLSINNTTDAVNVDNGGTFTTGGGASIKKKLFVGGKTNISSGETIAGNSIVNSSGSLAISGDIVLYDTLTPQVISFADGLKGVPSFTTRSQGTKLIINPSISGSTVDTGLGISSSGLWVSSEDSSKDISFYLGESKKATINTSGINLPEIDTGINFSGALIKSVTGNKTYIIPNDDSSDKGYIFTDSLGISENIKINGKGQLALGLSESIIDTVTSDAVLLNLGENGVITDSVTAESGNKAIVALTKINQNTLNSTNLTVTTDLAVSMYIEGAIIKGLNETITKSCGLYIDSVSQVNDGLSTVIDIASSLLIKNSPSGGFITKSRSILVENGISEFEGQLLVSSGETITGNSIVNSSGSLTISGDIVLYDTLTPQVISFADGLKGVPSFTTRSQGTKLIINPSISGSTVDTGLGLSSSGLWVSSEDSTKDISFYLGESKKVAINNTGIIVSPDSSVFNIKPNIDNQGISITGGDTTGSKMNVYGNGDISLEASSTGSIKLSTGTVLTERISLSDTGETLFSCETDSTGSNSTSSIKTLGGVSIAKTLSVGQGILLDFNQPYKLNGNASGELNIQSRVTSVDSSINYFTNDGDNSDSNYINLYGLGVPASITDSESLKIGYSSVDNGYIIKTNNTGTGLARELTIQSGSNTDQLKLNTDSSIYISSTLTSDSITSGALLLDGGISINNSANAVDVDNGGTFTTGGGASIKKDVYIGGNLNVAGDFSGGITNPVLNISSASNTVATPTVVKSVLTKNGVNRSLVATFRMNTVNSGTTTSFEIEMPDLVTNITSVFDVSILASGYSNDSSPVNVENLFGYSLVGGINTKISFTSQANSSHTIQAIFTYTV